MEQYFKDKGRDILDNLCKKALLDSVEIIKEPELEILSEKLTRAEEAIKVLEEALEFYSDDRMYRADVTECMITGNNVLVGFTAPEDFAETGKKALAKAREVREGK